MKANLLGRPHYSEPVGAVEARTVLTTDGEEFFWRVEAVTGFGIVKLKERDSTSKKWPLLEVEKAKQEARKFARSLLRQEKKAA